ncbi:MAG: hypothetical protein CTY35_02635 [Methylotenera sp.]|nr:MAG: hypothetical protein CTY35_02635 [Methylotenera sp.]
MVYNNFTIHKVHYQLKAFKLERFIKLVIGCVFLFTGHLSSAQVSTYSFNEQLDIYNEITGGTTAYAAPWDNHTPGSAHLAPFGFDFIYNGNPTPITQCYISPNGFITFGATQPTNLLSAPISSGLAFTGVVCPLGTDLVSGVGAQPVTYTTEGTAPNRVFVVQWKNVERKLSTGVFNFQIRLYETTNAIELRYGFCFPDDTTPITAQVGLRGPTNVFLNGNVNNRFQTGANLNQTWFTKSVKGTANSNTMNTSVAEYPDNGLVYTYTPPPTCSSLPVAGAPSNLQIGTTSIAPTSFVGNSFVPFASPDVQYIVLRSLTNTPPDGTILTNGTFYNNGSTIALTYFVVSNNSTSSFVQTGLNPNTPYFYWVVPYNGLCLGAPFYNLANMISATQTTCIPAPSLITPATGINGNGFTANWNPVLGATDYLIDVSTNSAFTALVPGFIALSSAGLTTITLTDLPPMTVYYYRVRAVGLGCSVNSGFGVVNLSLTCGYYFVPYTQNFDATAVGAIPPCTTVVNDNADALLWSTQTINPASTPRALYINKNPAADMDDWFFLPGIKLTGGTTYRLTFRYNSLANGTFTEKLRVRIGDGPSVAQMNVTILDLPNIINTVYQLATVDFTPVTTGVYYYGFQGYSFANQSYLVLDDINIKVAPSCFEPENLALAVSGITTSTISFDPPLTVPSQGYDYFLSNSPTVPTGATTPTGSLPFGSSSLNLVGLTASSQYYLWIRGNCGPGNVSVWSSTLDFSTDCNPPTFTTITPGIRCGLGTVSLSAIPNAGSTTEWYDMPVGGTLLATGNNYVTPSLSATTTYYVQAKAAGAIATLGATNPNNIAGAKSIYNVAAAVNLTITTATQLVGFDIFPISSGQNGLLVIRNSLAVAVASVPFTTSVVGGSTPQTIPINYNFVPGNYTIAMTTVPTSGLMSNIENVIYPYSNSVADITGNNFDNSYYLYFYNWKFTTTCLSPMTPISATVTVPPAIGLSAASDTICSGESTFNVSVIGAGSFDTFTWSPAAGVSGSVGAGYTFNPIETTVYTLTAAQTSGSFCSDSVIFTVNVNPSPPTITILPGDITLCEGSIQQLSATFGASSAINIINETFEGTPTWTTSNFSTGGTIANADWTLRNSVYSYTSGTWIFNASSNDASQFYMSNSDAQGSPSSNVTRTYLESPAFSLVGFSSASLSFWHYLRWIVGNKAQVQISIDNGGSWTLLSSHVGTIGGASAFNNPIVNLDPYLGNPQVKIRFYYEATWDYGWAIDNVRVFGIVATAVNWSPDTDLYTDNLATIPYVLGTPSGAVYCKPTANRTYTATVTTVDNCTSQSTINIGFDALPIGGTLSGSQVLCGGSAPSSITLTGNSPSVARWESADNAAFTINVTPIANTTNTLTAVEMGAIPTIKYFRAVSQNGVCPPAYSDVVAVEYPSTTWNGTTWSNGSPDATKKVIFAGDFTSTGDIEACSIEVQATRTVTIASGHTLTVSNEVTVLGTPATTNLIFQNTASLIQLNNAVNSGSIRYIRNATPMVRNDYTYWSSPVAGQVLNVFSPLTNPSRYYVFDNASYNWLSVPGASTMIPAKGYIIRAPSNYSTSATTTYVGQFVGVPNNGNYSIPIVVNTIPNPIQDRNLIGNPYPSAIDADLLLAANLSTLQGSFYFWTHNTPITNFVYTANDYAVYNQSGGTAAAINPGINNNPPNQFIAAGQGFFVQGLNSGTLTFTNAMRVAGSNASFFRNSQQNTTVTREKHRVWLNLINTQGAFKQLLAGYIQDATNAMDNHFDSEIAEAGNSISFYSVLGDKKLTIQGRALPFTETDVVPLGYRTTYAGTYAIQLADFDGLFALGQDIFLEDKLLNVVHDLRTSNYEFTTAIGTVEDRFVLKFQNETLSIPEVSLQNIIVIKNQNAIDITASSTITLKEVKVFDMRGRLITSLDNINSYTAKVTNLNIANQVLLVQITDVEGKTVTKKLVY